MTLTILYPRTVVLFTLVAVCLLLTPTVVPSPATTEFDECQSLIARIEAKKPQYIFIGNSMLDSRISTYYFNKLTGTRSLSFWEGGAMSAVWYLLLKNVVVASEVRPETVFIFFRNTSLTEPFFRTEGKYRELLEKFMCGNDSVVQSVLQKKEKLNGALLQHAESLYPVLNNQSKNILFSVPDIMTWGSHLFGFEFDHPEVKKFFSEHPLRSVTDDGENSDTTRSYNFDFTNAVNHSFLPHLIETAHINNLNLIFVRVQQRPPPDGSFYQSNELKNYIRALKHYLKKYNCNYIDFTGHPKITLKMYGPGDHIAKTHKEQYTRIFIEEVKNLL